MVGLASEFKRRAPNASGKAEMRGIAVVTGASAGVGRATARELARRGYGLALLARGEEGLKAAAREVEEAGQPALVLPTDVADAEQVEASARETERNLGPIEAWVNDAMASVFASFWDIRPEEYRRVTEVTYLGVVNGTRAALRRMRPRGRGVIVQVGSALAYRGIPLQSAYCGAKHAVQGFTDSVRAELHHEGSAVRITEVHLPALNTPQFGWVLSRLPRRARPVPPIYQPEVAARAIAWAVEHDRRQVWVGASTAGTILADRLVPGLLDRYLGRTGVESQQTEQPEEPSRPHNLWEPVSGDHGAHGAFGDRAHGRSAQLWAATHRAVLAAAGLAGAAAAVAAWRRAHG
jgi:NAD(P)-dependent dehydrogenase (short-subunit alcohol dehydrogenase family)